MLDINRIRELIPHRYPMLLVDRVLEVSETSAVGIKNVSANESFFEGHFPDHPVMPGVLIAESLAQLGAILVMNSLEKPEEKLILFASIENCKFRRQVVPGDQLRLEVERTAQRRSAYKMKAIATVEGKKCAEAVMSCHVVDRPKPE